MFVASILLNDSSLLLYFTLEFWLFISLTATFLWRLVTIASLKNSASFLLNHRGFSLVKSSSGFLPINYLWTRTDKHSALIGETVSSQEDWCFFARLLSGIDSFDASNWFKLDWVNNAIAGGKICAPEFFSNYSTWVNKISEFDVTNNILFILDLDGLTRLFVFLKVFGRYGTYLPEFICFGWLIYLLITKKNTAIILSRLITTLQLCVFITLATLFLPFAPVELFTGYKADGYSELVKVIFLILVLFYLSSISIWELQGLAKKEIYVITLFFLFFSLVLISCSNLWIFFFSLEGISFCTIIFFIFNFSGQGHISDAVRYFCLNAIASGSLMLSLGLGEFVTNTADYNEFKNFFMLNFATTVPNSFTLAAVLFLIGSLFKLGIFPFNVYEVDTYKKASYIVIYFSSIVTKVPFFFVWLKLVFRVLPFINVVFPAIFVLGLLTAVIGVIGASFQTVLRPFLTYSSMGHIGLILTSLTTNTLLGIKVAYLYFLTYIVAMSVIYMTLNALEGMKLDLHGVHQLRELRANFSIACCFSLGVLALAGFPLTIGFFAKAGLLANLIKLDAICLAVVVLILNIISFSYYLRVLKIIWIEVNSRSALKFVLIDMKKIQQAAAERTFFAVRALSGLLVFSAAIFLISFKFIIIITGTLLCVAVYSVDWWFFVRHTLVGLKAWLFYSTKVETSLANIFSYYATICTPEHLRKIVWETWADVFRYFYPVTIDTPPFDQKSFRARSLQFDLDEVNLMRYTRGKQRDVFIRNITQNTRYLEQITSKWETLSNSMLQLSQQVMNTNDPLVTAEIEKIKQEMKTIDEEIISVKLELEDTKKILTKMRKEHAIERANYPTPPPFKQR
jgi:NADH-quinone oxidoreductase subunit N